MCYAIVYRKDTTLAAYSPEDVSDMTISRLQYGHAIPIADQTKLAVSLGAKSPLHPTQLPVSMYTALFELLIPESMYSHVIENPNN